MNKQELEKLKELSSKATKGPWNDSGKRGVTQTAHFTRDVWKIPKTLEDISFIAASREAVPALIEQLERANALLKEVSKDDPACMQEEDVGLYMAMVMIRKFIQQYEGQDND